MLAEKIDRRTKILSGLGGLEKVVGVEIGALDKPLVLKSDGPIYYVDFTDTATLRAKYVDFPDHDFEKIVEVDAIWGENTLAEALGHKVPVDYVVASHVIEHVPDLVSWFEEIRAILRPGSTVHLAIPDRRYTFDILRQETRIADVVHAYVLKARKPLPHQLLDFQMHFLPVDAKAAWQGTVPLPDLLDKSQFDRAVEVTREVIRTDVYLDVHCWVFTPLSFAKLMEQLSALQLMHFACVIWHETEQDDLEFMVTMRESADVCANVESWAVMANGLTNRG